MTSHECANKRIYQVPVPHETLGDYKDEMEAAYVRHGAVFKCKEEFELFWMLPLDKKQREQLLMALSEEKYFLDELMCCIGVPDLGAPHRLQCISCCMRFKPCCAQPYY